MKMTIYQWRDTLGISFPILCLWALLLTAVLSTSLYLPSAQAGINSSNRPAIPPDTSGWLSIDQLARETKTNKRDPYYEKGKDAFLGKGKYTKYNFCLLVEDKNDASQTQLKPLNRKTALLYRKSTVVSFVAKLYDCDQPEQWVLNYFDKQTAGYIVYYLNKRFKLHLQQ